MNQCKQRLASIPIFENLPDNDLDLLARHAIYKTYPRNTLLIQEGDSPGSMYLLDTGLVTAFLTDREGKEVILSREQPGAVIGELALLDDQPRSASVITVEKSDFYVISKKDFQSLLRTEPEFAVNIIRALTQRIRHLTLEVRGFAIGNVYQRVVNRIMHMSEPDGDKRIVPEKLTQQELANMVGASREMVNRVANDLTRGGYISIDQKIITIHREPPSGW